MKKIMILVAAIAIVIFANAQIQFGIKAGLNVAKLSPNSSFDSYTSKLGFHGGLLVAIPLFDNFCLEPEVMYSGQGAKFTDVGFRVGNAPPGKGTFNFGYINVPILFRYYDPLKFFAEAGPQIGFSPNAKSKGIKSTDFGGTFGIGYLSPLNIGIDTRYNLGFIDVAQQSTGFSFKNHVIQIGVFYLFKEDKKKS